MENEKAKTRKLKLLKVVPLAVMGGILVLFGSTLHNLTFTDIVSYTPSSPLLAALVIWGIYAVKSLSVVFPLVAIYMGAGMLFPPVAALAVNVAGLLLCVSIPYFIGRFSCSDLADSLAAKYPKVRGVKEWGSRNDLLTSYLLRVVGFMPGDVVSLFLGASRFPFPSYVVGSLLGLAPYMVIYTLLGGTLSQPLSPKFLLLLAALVLLSLASMFFIAKKQNKKKEDSRRQ